MCIRLNAELIVDLLLSYTETYNINTRSHFTVTLACNTAKTIVQFTIASESTVYRVDKGKVNVSLCTLHHRVNCSEGTRIHVHVTVYVYRYTAHTPVL